jgi:hypothetical protein
MITILVMIFLFRALSNEFWNVKKKTLSRCLKRTIVCVCVDIVIIIFIFFCHHHHDHHRYYTVYREDAEKRAHGSASMCEATVFNRSISSEIDAFFFHSAIRILGVQFIIFSALT